MDRGMVNGGSRDKCWQRVLGFNDTFKPEFKNSLMAFCGVLETRFKTLIRIICQTSKVWWRSNIKEEFLISLLNFLFIRLTVGVCVCVCGSITLCYQEAGIYPLKKTTTVHR